MIWLLIGLGAVLIGVVAIFAALAQAVKHGWKQ